MFTESAHPRPATISGVTEFSDDERKHLEFVQAAIVRMATASGWVKGWAVTVGVGAYGVGRLTLLPELSLIGVVAVALLALLDARYLMLERRFRALFERVRKRTATDYDMAIRPADASLDSAVKSWSVLGFYGALLALGVVASVSALIR